MTQNTIGELRSLLFDTVRGVKDGSIDIEKARTVSELSQTIINTAKAETDFMKVTGKNVASEFIPDERRPLERPRGPDLPAPTKGESGPLVANIGRKVG